MPLLFIPFMKEHHRNAAQANRDGYGLTMLIDDLTSEIFAAKINEMTTNQKYKERTLAVQSLFKDNPIKPMDEAMFWIEYVARNKGAKHLKSSAINLSWCSYVMFDVAVFYSVLFVSSFVAWVFTIRLSIERYRARENTGKFKYY